MRERRRGYTLVAAVFVIALLLGAGTTAHALSYSTTIEGASCLTCFGSSYTLTVNEISSGGGNSTYNVLYSVNTTGYNGSGDYLNSVAFKVSNFGDIVTAPTVSGVTGFSGTAQFAGIDASGCSGGGTSGFLCAQSSGLGVNVPNGTYNFAFNGLVLKTGTLFTDVSGWSIKALYGVSDNGTFKQAGITSENGVVPVPGTLLMFGLGFALFIGWHYHRSGRVMIAPCANA